MQYIRTGLKLIQSYLPSQLPQTGIAMETWMTEVLQLAKLPDNDSFRQAASTAIMQLTETTNTKSKHYFVRVLRKRVSNQLAYQIIDDIRNKEKIAREQSLQDSQVSQA